MDPGGVLRMRAIEVPKYGSSDVLEIVERELPTPGSGEVVLESYAIGVNFADIKRRRGVSGRAPDPPFVPGLEAAGVVTAVGDGVEYAVGDRVVALVGAGAYAESVLADTDSLLDIPDSMSFKEAAGFPVQFITAHNCLHEWGRLESDESVLIHAAAGGVGTAALQLANEAGAEVFATASTSEKLKYASRLGADHGINYTTNDVASEINRLTEDGIDLVLDGVGGDAFEAGQTALSPFGRIVTIGTASGTEGTPDLDHLRVQNASILGYHIGEAIDQDPDKIHSAVDQLNELLADGRIEIVIGETFALEDAANAHNLVENRESTGKVLLTP
jgi:NADPH2:quinone reductase